MIKKSLMLVSSLVLLSQATHARDMVIAGQPIPPFNWEENGEVKGGMVDVMKAVCAELKYNCKFQITVLARALKQMEDGEIDSVMTLTVNPDRAAYSYSSPLIIATDVVYMANKKSQFKPKSIQDFSGWTVSGVRSSSSLKQGQKQLANVKDVTWKEETDNKTLVERMENQFHGPKSVIVGQDDPLTFLANADNVNNLEKVFDSAPAPQMVAFGKKKVTSEEFDKISKAIEKLKADGTVKKILEKWKLRAAQ